MKKIMIIGIATVWVLVAGVVVFALLSAPPKDSFFAFKSIVTSAQDYLNRQPIDVESIDASHPNGKFAQHLVQYLRKLQLIEKELNQKQSLASVVIESQNLSDIDSINNNYSRVAEFEQVIKESHVEIENSIEQLVKGLAAIQSEDLVFDYKEQEKTFAEEQPHRAELSKLRLSLAAYLKTLLEFVQSRQGLYKASGARLEFNNQGDQEYYNGLLLGVSQIKDQIDEKIQRERQLLRDFVNQNSAVLNAEE